MLPVAVAPRSAAASVNPVASATIVAHRATVWVVSPLVGLMCSVRGVKMLADCQIYGHFFAQTLYGPIMRAFLDVRPDVFDILTY